MLIIWDYFGVIAQDAFWYTSSDMANSNGKGEHMKQIREKVDLGQVSWDDYTIAVSEDIGTPLDEVRERYRHHEIKQSNILAIHSLTEHTHVLLSNASSEYLRPIMANLGLDTLFADIFVSSDIGFAKPDQRAFNYVLTAMKAEPADSIMIDDSARNIDSVRAMGMYGILFDPTLNIVDQINSLVV